MKKLFVYIFLSVSFVSYSQEVTTLTTDSVAAVSDTADSSQALEALEAAGMPMTADDPSEDGDTDAPNALDDLNNAVEDENIESTTADADAPENPDVKEAIDPSGPALVIGLGILPTHQDIAKDNIAMPLRFSVGADNLFSGFGVILLYERGAATNGPYVDNDGELVDNYARFTLGPTYRINKLRIAAAMDLFGPKGFFLASGADDGVIGTGRKFIGVSYDVFKGLYVGLDYSAYAGLGVMINYSIPLGEL